MMGTGTGAVSVEGTEVDAWEHPGGTLGRIRAGGAGAHLWWVLVWDAVRSDGFSCAGGTRVVALGGGMSWHRAGMAAQRVLSPPSCPFGGCLAAALDPNSL